MLGQRTQERRVEDRVAVRTDRGSVLDGLRARRATHARSIEAPPPPVNATPVDAASVDATPERDPRRTSCLVARLHRLSRGLTAAGPVLLAAVLAGAAGCATQRTAAAPGSLAQRSLPELESAEALEIARLEDARSLGSGRIVAWTRVASPALRRRALLALARLQAPETLGACTAALDDPEPSVRIMAAFAVGQLGLSWEPLPEAARAAGERRLLKRLETEKHADALGAVVLALGKIGTSASLPPLSRLAWQSPEQRAPAALALGRIARTSGGKLTHPDALRALSRMASSEHAESERTAAIWALAQMPCADSRDVLLRGLRDPAAEVRAAAAKGLAEMGLDDDAMLLGKRLTDPDRRVAAEAGRALAKIALRTSAGSGTSRALSALGEAGPWTPGVALAVSTEPLRGTAAAALFAGQAAALSGREQCWAALGHDRAAGGVEALARCGGAAVEERERLALQARLLGELVSGPAANASLRKLLALSRHEDPRVRSAAASALGGATNAAARRRAADLVRDDDAQVATAALEGLERSRGAEGVPAVAELLQRAGSSGDPDLLLTAVSAAASLEARAVAPGLRRALEHRSPEVRAAASELLGRWTGARPAVAPPPWPRGPWADDPVPARPYARLETPRGTLRIQLFASENAVTVRHFLHLIRSGFYDGLTFHRIVPDYVSQGGDPRGDGSGGPGHAIRCEPHLRPYRAGSVGMALAGKDTGGSQFFIAHAPQPHLDGRYTLFGQVVEGFEVALALQPGDRILHAHIESPQEAD